MSLLKIAVLDMNNNHPNEGMRCILQIIRSVQGTLTLDNDHAELRFDTFNVRSNDELPGLDYDVYISSGGPGSPLPSTEAWEAPYFSLIDQLFEWNKYNDCKKHVFLICHSFQLVSRHLKLGKLSRRRSTSFGIFPMHKTDDGCTDPLFGNLPEPFFAVDSRDYQLLDPDLMRIDDMGASILCLEKVRPYVDLPRAVMAIRFSPEIVGTQFHPEADDEGMLRHFLTEAKQTQIITNFGHAKYDEMMTYLQDPEKVGLTQSTIIPGFIQRAIESLSAVPA